MEFLVVRNENFSQNEEDVKRGCAED